MGKNIVLYSIKVCRALYSNIIRKQANCIATHYYLCYPFWLSYYIKNILKPIKTSCTLFIYVTTIYIRSTFSIQFYFDYPSTPPFCEEMLADITHWWLYQVLVAGYGAPWKENPWNQRLWNQRQLWLPTSCRWPPRVWERQRCLMAAKRVLRCAVPACFG